MKRNQIDQLFTAKVTKYIADGYTINTNSMGGSQGEVAKVDLVKGNTLLRVWLNKEYLSNWDDDSFKFHGNVMVLRVGKWNREAKEAMNDQWKTVWMNDLETIHQEVFYEIGRNNSCYYGTEEEAIAAQQVHRERRYGRDYSPDKRVWYRNDVARNAAYNYLRRKVGYKRLKWEDIEVLKIMTTKETPVFYVVYHGTRYKLV